MPRPSPLETRVHPERKGDSAHPGHPQADANEDEGVEGVNPESRGTRTRGRRTRRRPGSGPACKRDQMAAREHLEESSSEFFTSER